jgi:hypothetical protein
MQEVHGAEWLQGSIDVRQADEVELAGSQISI